MSAASEHADLVRALTRAALHDDAIHRAQHATLRRHYQRQHTLAAYVNAASRHGATTASEASLEDAAQRGVAATEGGEIPAALVAALASAPPFDAFEQERRRAAGVSRLGFAKRHAGGATGVARGATAFVPSRWDSRSGVYSTQGPIVVKYGVSAQGGRLYSTTERHRSARDEGVGEKGDDAEMGMGPQRQRRLDYFGDPISDSESDSEIDPSSARHVKARLMAAAPVGIDEAATADDPDNDARGGGTTSCDNAPSNNLSLTSPFAAVDVGSIALTSPHSVYALREYRRKSAAAAAAGAGAGAGAGAAVPVRSRERGEPQQQQQQLLRPRTHPVTPANADAAGEDAGRAAAAVVTDGQLFAKLFPAMGRCSIAWCASARDVIRAMKMVLTTDASSLPGGQRVSTLVMSGLRLGTIGEAIAAGAHPQTSIQWFGDEDDIEEEEFRFRSDALKLVFPVLSSRGMGHWIHHLEADGCDLHDVDAAALARLLRRKPSEAFPRVQLTTLSLQNNDITDLGVELLKKAVKYNEHIKSIDLAGNPRIANANGALTVLRERLVNNRNGTANLSALQRLWGD